MIMTEQEYARVQKRMLSCMRKKDLLESKCQFSADAAKQAQIKDLNAEICVLNKTLQEYLTVWKRQTPMPDLSAIQDTHIWLIQARVFLRWDRQELANKLNISKRQLVRYESSNYASASLATIRTISNILNHELRKLT